MTLTNSDIKSWNPNTQYSWNDTSRYIKWVLPKHCNSGFFFFVFRLKKLGFHRVPFIKMNKHLPTITWVWQPRIAVPWRRWCASRLRVAVGFGPGPMGNPWKINPNFWNTQQKIDIHALFSSKIGPQRRMVGFLISSIYFVKPYFRYLTGNKAGFSWSSCAKDLGLSPSSTIAVLLCRMVWSQ